MTLIFYSFRRCPYAMRARMALAYAKIEVDHREILLKDKPQSMLDYSPKGTVPVLVVDGLIIDESLDVMNWALVQNDPENCLLKDDENRHNKMMELIQICDTKFKPQLDCYKYSDRHELSEEQYRDKTLWFLELLNNQLCRYGNLITEKPTLADMAIFPFIRQFAFVNKKWFDNTHYTHLQYWLENNIKSMLFKSIMQKHPLWIDPPACN